MNRKGGRDYLTGLNHTRVEVRHRLAHLHRGLSRVDLELLSMKSS